MRGVQSQDYIFGPLVSYVITASKIFLTNTLSRPQNYHQSKPLFLL